MSSMLEQAIVDANALKEAAVKNAEQLIIEKYSADIKEAVDTLLEQEDEMGMAGQETFDDMEVPSASVPGEDIFEDACPSDEETVTLDLDGLEAALQAMPEEPGASQEEVATELAPEGPEEEEEMALALEEDRDIEIDDDLIEKLIVDLAPRTSGWAGRPKSELDHEVDLDLARMQDSDFQEENEALLQSLQEELSKVKEEDEWKDYYYFNPSGMIVYLMKAVQELTSQVDVLKAQISGSSDFTSLKTAVSGSN